MTPSRVTKRSRGLLLRAAVVLVLAVCLLQLFHYVMRTNNSSKPPKHLADLVDTQPEQQHADLVDAQSEQQHADLVDAQPEQQHADFVDAQPEQQHANLVDQHLEAQQPAASLASKHLEVISAWYGVEGRIEEHRGGLVAERLRQNVAQNGGRLVLNGDLNAFFGFDPARNVVKQAGIHVRYRGQEQHLRASEGQPFQFPANGGKQQGHVEVIYAWYGAPRRTRGGPAVVERLRQNIAQNGGRIVLNGNLTAFFGFDPAPGVPKKAGIAVHYLNAELLTLHAIDGQPFEFPIDVDQYVDVIDAWYGVEGRIYMRVGGLVVMRLRQNVADNGGRLVLKGDFKKMFTVDPAPGKVKQAGIHVRYRGRQHHLRATEGQPFQFP